MKHGQCGGWNFFVHQNALSHIQCVCNLKDNLTLTLINYVQMWYIFVLLVGLLIIVVYVRCIDVKQSKFHINNKRENREEYLQIEIYILHNPQEWKYSIELFRNYCLRFPIIQTLFPLLEWLCWSGCHSFCRIIIKQPERFPKSSELPDAMPVNGYGTSRVWQWC